MAASPIASAGAEHHHAFSDGHLGPVPQCEQAGAVALGERGRLRGTEAIGEWHG